MTNRAVHGPVSWGQMVLISVSAAALLLVLTFRFFQQMSEPPSLLQLATRPPRDDWFFLYPSLTFPPLALALWRRTTSLMLFTQVALFVVGFAHIQWLIGSVPVKFDLRLLEVTMTGHAVAWGSYACVVSALVLGVWKWRAPGTA